MARTVPVPGSGGAGRGVPLWTVVHTPAVPPTIYLAALGALHSMHNVIMHLTIRAVNEPKFSLCPEIARHEIEMLGMSVKIIPDRRFEILKDAHWLIGTLKGAFSGHCET